MSNLINFENKKIKKRPNICSKSNNIDDYLKSIDKLNNVEEYVENNKEINNVIRMLVKYYHVPYDILACLIDEVNEKVAMEYETSKT